MMLGLKGILDRVHHIIGSEKLISQVGVNKFSQYQGEHMADTKKRRDVEIYESYWKFTAAHLDITGTKFGN